MKMKRKTTILAAIVVAAAIGSQVASAATATTKLGVLNFALTDAYQHYVYLNGAYATNPLVGSACVLENCGSTGKYVAGTDKIDNKRIITAIGKAMGVTFTSKAQLLVNNYDNVALLPPYPPYLACGAETTANNTFNGPEDLFDGPTEYSAYDNGNEANWPNENQINWVDYSETTDPANYAAWVWPKAYVHISDPSNINGNLDCVDVSCFFLLEEAYCYFCWDTVDRVTTGSTSATGIVGEPCIGNTSCKYKASGTTKWYFTIKFNNVYVENQYLDLAYTGTVGTGHSALPYLITPSSPTVVQSADQLTFVVSGVVSYPWTYKAVDGLYNVWGTMTMSQANGYGRNPFCGVLTGSVKITESDDAKISVCF